MNTIMGLEPTMFWIVLAIALAITEAATMGLTAIWFALGSLVGALSAYLQAPVYLQISLMMSASAVFLLFTRPVITKWLHVKKEPTNLDRTIGQRGIVMETINNQEGTGQVKVGGLMWTAHSQEDQIIPEHAEVEVVAIQGVKAIVKPL